MTAEHQNPEELRIFVTSNGVLGPVYHAFEILYSKRGLLSSQENYDLIEAVADSMATGVRAMYAKYLIECPGYPLSYNREVKKPEKVFSKLGEYRPLAKIQIGAAVSDDDILKLLINLGVLPKRFKFSKIDDLKEIIKPLSKITDPSKVSYAYQETDEFGFSFINLSSIDEPLNGLRANLFCNNSELKGVPPGYSIDVYVNASVASKIVESILFYVNEDTPAKDISKKDEGK